MKKTDISSAVRANALDSARKLPQKSARIVRETALTRTWIDARLLEDESAVQELAWVEYRYLTPLARTELFTTMYHDAYIKVYAKRFPEADSSKKQPCAKEFARNSPSVMSALWKARAIADVHGVPYGVFLETILESHLIKDRWNNPPRPNQLYGKLVGPRLRDLPTREMIGERLYSADWDQRFLAENYSGDPVQKAAIALLADLVTHSDDPAATLADYLCERRSITVDVARETFGIDLTREAIAKGKGVPVERATEGQTPYVPACVGNLWEDEDSSCQFCPVKPQCAQVSQRVREDVIALTGSPDPRGDLKRKQGRARQQKFRDKKAKAAIVERLTTDAQAGEVEI